MSSPLAASGAVSEPSEYATLSMDRHITGLWTQRNPLRDADVPYLYGKNYSATRYDSLIDGINREITSRLTNARRPGSSVWNANSFPPINSFYAFKFIQEGTEIVRTIVDGKDGVIYDATSGGKVSLFTKDPAAGKTRFLGLNAILYFADGVDKKKLVRSAKIWKAAKTFTAGNFIIDSNLNIQVATGATSAGINSVTIETNVCTINFTNQIPLSWVVGTRVTFADLTGLTALNGTTQVLTVVGPFTVQFAFTHANYGPTTDAGTAATAGGNTGGSEPVWATTKNASTVDGAEQWVCKGPSIQEWTPAAATVAPTLANVALGSTGGGAWAASTFYWPSATIVDSNNNLQQLIVSGTTGGSVPVWNVTLGASTTDGGCTWTNIGTANWQAVHNYGVGDTINASYSVRVRVIVEYIGSRPVWGWDTESYEDLFVCSTAGISGASTPTWSPGVGAIVRDGTVVWKNSGTKISRTAAGASTTNITNSELISDLQNIVDSNGNQQNVMVGGVSGTVAPTWSTVTNANTKDNQITWFNVGQSPSSANTEPWTYAFSGRNSVVGDVTTASPTAQITLNNNSVISVQGPGFADVQIDVIRIFRTVVGGSALIFLADIPNPGTGANWTYQDSTSDLDLIAQIPAPIANSNDPAPDGFTAPIYHLGRVWGIVNNQVVYSGGPDTLDGNGNSAFPPLNNIPYPEIAVRLDTITLQNGGVLVYTTTHVYVVLGTGTANNPFYTTRYMADVGILSYDCMELVGSTFYLFTGKRKFVSLDPGAGYTEVGFPIGDQFKNVTTGAGSATTGDLYSPEDSYVTWHEESSGDTAIYVSDGAVGWFRFSPVSSPESGYIWSPRAAVAVGTSAVQSIETSPGRNELLIGPSGGGGPILVRNAAVSADNGVAYPSWDVKGNIVLCDSGEIAEIAHIGLKSLAVGSKPKVSLLLGEISATLQTPFDQLEWTSNDPPDLPPSTTLFSDRYTALQNGVCPKCDNFQLKVDYGVQAVPDELLKFSIYGAKHSERKQQ